jgi:hypothetical protein
MRLRHIAARLIFLGGLLLPLHAAADDGAEPLPGKPVPGKPADNEAMPDDWDMRKELNERYPVEFRERVHAAIRTGTAWLVKVQRPDGSWNAAYRAGYPMGTTALGALTLSKCGVKRDAPALVKAWAYLRKQRLERTYSVAVLLMALDAKYAPARDPFEKVEYDRYGHRKTKGDGDPCEKLISAEDLKLMKRAVAWLIEQQNADGVWRYPHGGFDLSNTQYALLGLRAAGRCGIKVPSSVYLSALKFLLAHQERFGRPVLFEANEVRGDYKIVWKEKALARGFRYADERHPVSGSMTTAGLAGLIICNEALWSSRRYVGKRRAAARKGIRDAMAWMQTWFSVKANPLEPPKGRIGPTSTNSWHYYYLYGLERAGILARVRWFGEFDWYFDGALYLISQQARTGAWPRGRGMFNETCFALLFLKRATSRMKLPAITPDLQAPKTDK